MKQEEIHEFIKGSFENINKHFHKAIDHFEADDIRKFRSEIKKLKVFLHLVSMESEDGLSYLITKRMKTIYGYLGIIQNFQLQLETTNDYLKKSLESGPTFYVDMLEKELEYWKKLSKDFIDPDYTFFGDEKEVIAKLTVELSQHSIKKFIHYTLYEIQSMSGLRNEETLDNVRKFLEDIYFNLPFIRPYLTSQQSILMNEKGVSECLSLFGNFSDKSTAVVLLQTMSIDTLDEQEKELIKQLENDWLREKKEIKIRLAAKLDAMHIKDNLLNELSLQE